MDKVKEVLKNCTDTLSVLNKKIRKALTDYQESLDAPSKSDIKKLTNIQNAYSMLQSDYSTMKSSSKYITTLIKQYMTSGEGFDDIETAMSEYENTKRDVYMQIGFISKALEVQNGTDFDMEITQFMKACDNLNIIDRTIQSTEVLGGLDEVDFEDPAFLVDEQAESDKNTKTTKSGKLGKTTKSNKSTKVDKPEKLVTVEDGSESSQETSKVPDTPETPKTENSEQTEQSSESDTPDVPNAVKNKKSKKDKSKKDLKNDSNDDSRNNTDWDKDIKSGGLNKESDQYVTVGGNDIVVGERAKYCIRQKILQVKHADNAEQQFVILGVKDEDELEEKCKTILQDPEAYVYELVDEYELDALLQEALANLKNRVKASFTKYKKSDVVLSGLDKNFEHLIDQIDEAQNDLSLWSNIATLPRLYKITQCINALQQRKLVLKCKTSKDMEKLLEKTNEELKELENFKRPDKVENPGVWEEEFKLPNMEIDDPIKCIVKIEKTLASQLVELEIYYACVSEYIDQQWPAPENKPNIIDIKYRLYLMSLVSSPLADDIKKLCKKLKVGDYKNFSRFIKSV